jgi:hypothetical protein
LPGPQLPGPPVLPEDRHLVVLPMQRTENTVGVARLVERFWRSWLKEAKAGIEVAVCAVESHCRGQMAFRCGCSRGPSVLVCGAER